METIVGTSGYSFDGWVGQFYPADIRREDMFAYYSRRFSAVELNFTYYRMPTAAMMDRFGCMSPAGFQFWVKANRDTTHGRIRAATEPFLESLLPLREAGKLAGVLLQFPQSFHRTVANRRYLAQTLEDLADVPAAVEFRHRSWAVPSTVEGFRQRQATLVVPDVPKLAGLFRIGPTVTGPVGYLRLHSRRADAWYAGGRLRYDYDYSDAELADLARQWSPQAIEAERVFVFFNNCHRGQAAENARRFREIVNRMATTG